MQLKHEGTPQTVANGSSFLSVLVPLVFKNTVYQSVSYFSFLKYGTNIFDLIWGSGIITNVLLSALIEMELR